MPFLVLYLVGSVDLRLNYSSAAALLLAFVFAASVAGRVGKTFGGEPFFVVA